MKNALQIILPALLISAIQVDGPYLGSSYSAYVNDAGVAAGTITFPTGYTRAIDLDITAATVGATAPTAVTIGTYRCLQFSQATAAETAQLVFEVPPDWGAASDMYIKLYWFAANADPVALGEVVEWTLTYRSIAEGEAYDNGSAVAISATWTETSDPGTDKGFYVTRATVDYDNANQPLAKEDLVGVTIDLHEVNTTYSGDPILCQAEVDFTSVALPMH